MARRWCSPAPCPTATGWCWRTAACSRATPWCGRAGRGSARSSRRSSSIRSTRQELFFFDGGPAWRADGVPAYVDFEGAIYGTPDLDGLGVKAAPDFDGPPLDPDADLPAATRESEALARAFLAERFPALAAAPLAGSKTCRYELTPDAHFVAARHPELASVWLLGGGSGHGFKHGPAMAERMAAALSGGAPMPALFGLAGRDPGASLRTAGATVRSGVGSAPWTTT